MTICKIGKDIVFSFNKNCEDIGQMMIEETIAKYIIDMCWIEDMSITVKPNFGDIRRALWNGLNYAIERKDEKVCGDIVRCMEYINGMEEESDESI